MIFQLKKLLKLYLYKYYYITSNDAIIIICFFLIVNYQLNLLRFTIFFNK